MEPINNFLNNVLCIEEKNMNYTRGSGADDRDTTLSTKLWTEKLRKHVNLELNIYINLKKMVFMKDYTTNDFNFTSWFFYCFACIVKMSYVYVCIYVPC